MKQTKIVCVIFIYFVKMKNKIKNEETLKIYLLYFPSIIANKLNFLNITFSQIISFWAKRSLTVL